MSENISKELLINITREVYYFELDRKEKIIQRLNYNTTIFIVLSGASFYFLNDLIKLKWHLNTSVVSIVFLFFFLLTILSLLISFFYLARGITGFKYSFLPVADDIIKDVGKIKTYSENIVKIQKDYGLSKKIIKQKYNFVGERDKFDDYILSKYQESSTNNSKNNDFRDEKLSKSIRF